MDGEHRRTGAGDGGDALFDGVVDVEQFQVEEHFLAGGDQRLAERVAVAAVKQLVADLVKLGAVAQRCHQGLGLSARIKIERDDQLSHGASDALPAKSRAFCPTGPCAASPPDIAMAPQ